MSKNAEGWIRHRGGKCPVGEGVKVDYRMRDGDVDDFGRDAVRLKWNHIGGCADIMAYRLHKPAEQVEACSKPELRSLPENYGEIIGGSVEGPIQWRDRITTIDFDIHSLTAERADLVQKLASEGFALIGRVVEQVEDMSDWRNWKAGDLVEYTGENGSTFYIAGVQYTVESIAHDFLYLDDEFDGHHKWTHCKEFKWHSRPST